MTESAFLSLADAAVRVGGISERAIRREIASGHLEAVRYGRRVLVVRESLEAWIEQQKAEHVRPERPSSYLAHIDALRGVAKARRAGTRRANTKEGSHDFRTR